jgi:hypothetical protein
MDAVISMIWTYGILADLGWLVAGLGLGVMVPAVWQRMQIWREARVSEWDPY